MPAHDARRWTVAADGSRTRYVGNAADYGIDATEGAIELAAVYGVNLADVEGTGSGGRITKTDIKSHIEDDE